MAMLHNAALTGHSESWLPWCLWSGSPDAAVISMSFVVLPMLATKQDRDAVIAVVEDARAAQEREAERLRDKLSGLGKSLTPVDPHANGAAVSANGDSVNDFSNASDDGHDDQVGNAEVRLGKKERG